MSRAVELLVLPAPVEVHGRSTYFADLRIGGTTVRVTLAEARAALGVLALQLGGVDVVTDEWDADRCECGHNRGGHYPSCGRCVCGTGFVLRGGVQGS